MKKLIADRYLPIPRIPASVAREAVPRHHLKVGARCVSSARRDLCRGQPAMAVPI